MSRKNLRFDALLLGLILILANSCTSKPGSPDTTSMQFKQYYIKGEELYLRHCSNCHQKNGTGLGLVYPPLNSSDYMEQNFENVLCLMKYGMKGEVLVNGKSFSQPMPGISTLTDLEIAQIATYIYNTWSHQRGLIDVRTVSPVMDSCTVTSD